MPSILLLTTKAVSETDNQFKKIRFDKDIMRPLTSSEAERASFRKIRQSGDEAALEKFYGQSAKNDSVKIESKWQKWKSGG